MADPRDAVLSRYPNAESQYHAPVRQYGQASSGQTDSWAIYVAPGLGQPLIGEGATEAQAWANAAQRLSQAPTDERDRGG